MNAERGDVDNETHVRNRLGFSAANSIHLQKGRLVETSVRSCEEKLVRQAGSFQTILEGV